MTLEERVERLERQRRSDERRDRSSMLPFIGLFAIIGFIAWVLGA